MTGKIKYILCRKTQLICLAFICLLLFLGTAFTTLASQQNGDILSISPITAQAATEAEQGEATFNQLCRSCHTIGGGKLIGPDLKGVTNRRDRNWLISFIVSPDQLIEQKDPLATQLVQEFNGMPMPNMGLSEQEAGEVLAYITMQSGGEQLTTTPEPTKEVPSHITVTSTPQKQVTEKNEPAVLGDADSGEDIFKGKTSLENGGPACISCHNVSGIGALGGGTVGKDLTKAFTTFGASGLTAVIKSAPFPIMTTVYATQLLTDDEVIDLVAFLEQVSSDENESSTPGVGAFILIGIAGLVVLVTIFHLIWRRRLRGVRQRLLKGGSR